MVASPTWITGLESCLEPSELVQPGSQVYAEETKTWAAQGNLKPNVLVRPQSVQQLARVLAYLHDTELDFAIRSGGVGSSSAKDVLISLAAFNAFEYDPKAETITIGAGQTWGEVDQKLEKAAPGHAGKEGICAFRSSSLMINSIKCSVYLRRCRRRCCIRRHLLGFIGVRNDI